MKKVPAHYRRFSRRFPKIAHRYEQLGESCLMHGPLAAKCCELIKLGIAAGAGLEGAVHSHVRRAREAGATPDEIRHAILLALTTVGFPRMMAALSWVDDELRRER